MAKCKNVVLQLNSNLNKYEITIFDGDCRIKKTFINYSNCLFFTAKSSKILVAIKPLVSGYIDSKFMSLNLTCKTQFTLDFTFAKRLVRSDAYYIFTLQDANYGLKLNGVLHFTRQ